MPTARNTHIKSLADAWVATVVVGVVLCLIGAAAIIVPAVFTLAVTWMIGIGALLVAGAEFLRAIRYFRNARAWWWPAGACVLAFVLGVLILVNPAVSAVSLTLLIVMFFLADGLWTLIFAFRVRPLGGWFWTVLSGIASIAVGVLIWLQLPSSALWAIGLLVGIRFLFSGTSLISLGLAAKALIGTKPASGTKAA